MTTRKTTEANAAPAAPPLGVKKVRRIEDYSEPIKEEIKTPLSQAIPIIMDDSDSDFIDELENTLNELEDQQTIIMRVERLPDFKKTGRYGRGSVKEFCGQLPMTPNFREDIQQAYGPGDYLLFLLDPNLHFIKGRRNRYTISIAEPVTGAATLPGARGPAPAQAPAPKTFIEQLKEYAEINTQLAKIANPTGAPAQALLPVAPVAPAIPLEEKITGMILDKILISKDESLTDKFISKYLGEDKQESFDWSAIAKEIVMPLVPVVLSLASAFLGNRPPSSDTPGNAGSVAPTMAGGDFTRQQITPVPIQNDVNRLLGICRNDCLNNIAVNRTAGAFDWLTTEDNADELQAIFSNEPEEILKLLRIDITIERVGWVAALQKEMSGVEDNFDEIEQTVLGNEENIKTVGKVKSKNAP